MNRLLHCGKLIILARSRCQARRSRGQHRHPGPPTRAFLPMNRLTWAFYGSGNGEPIMNRIHRIRRPSPRRNLPGSGPARSCPAGFAVRAAGSC